jgi:hypothetical protein
MFRCFIDDSGKNPSEPVFVWGAWWDGKNGRVVRFLGRSSKSRARIDYYRHTEAAARVGCFKTFCSSGYFEDL